jgi:cytochrome c peroxidase
MPVPFEDGRRVQLWGALSGLHPTRYIFSMGSGHFVLAAILGASAISGCNGERVAAPDGGPDGAALAVASPNGAVGVTAGSPVSYDATKGGATFTPSARGQLEYSITFESPSNGLSARAGTVVGQPAEPGVVWLNIVATDTAGHKASDRFTVVAFAPGLPLPTLPPSPFHYTDAAVPLPAHFQAIINGASVVATDNTPAHTPITDAGAALGRVLFYDPRLSANDRISCGGCHSAAIGFSDSSSRSRGFDGGLTGRHAPGLTNARFYSRGHFLWDESALTLDEQVLRAIQNGIEMGMTVRNLEPKLSATGYYPALFSAAFGTPAITGDLVLRAIAQFVRSLVSTGSRYDRAFDEVGTPNFAAVFTPEEVQGERLFRSTGCADCHVTVAQVSDSVHNIGLDAVTTDEGTGRGAFKAPSLRNVAVRPRYMHDGRFGTLERVVDFFDSGVQPNPDLDPLLRAPDGSPKRLRLAAEEKAALVAFLKTLTDSTFLTSPRFADPFKPATNPPPAPSIRAPPE